MRVRIAALALLSAAAAAAQGPSPAPSGDPGRWTPSETLKYRTIPDVRVSPDGRRVAFVVRGAVLESDKSEYREQVWIGRADGSESHAATFGDQSSNGPRWSSDGTRIAFLTKRGDRHVNVWLLPTDGGEAWRLTDSPSDVTQAAWSPDGRSIAFLAPDPDPADHERREKERDDARVVGSEERPVRLWLASVPAGPDGMRAARPLLTELGSIDDLDWSPDGRSIVVSHRPRPRANDWPKADVSIVDVAAGTVTPLAQTGAAETEPIFSPDGKWVAYVVTDDPPRWAHRRWIRVVHPDGTGGRDLAHSFDEDPELAGWSADGSTLYFSEPKGVSVLIYALEVESGRLRAVSKPDAVADGAHVNARGTWIGFVRQTPTDAVEAYASPLPAFSPVRVSRINADLPKHPLGETRAVRWTGDSGQEIEGLLTLPVGHAPGRRAPLLLVVHGGPAGVYSASAIMAPGPYCAAVFAAEGYALLRANPRGSSGYGTAFRQANVRDWGGGDYRDLMAGVDAVIAMGVADPDRLGIMGWSYGGFMTAWTITQTTRFKAASVGAAVTDLVSFTGTTDIPSFVPDYFGGDFWSEELLEVYRKHSAMAFVGSVRTPTLIQHGSEDPRVPISQGYQLYEALERRGVPVEMVVYPRQKHPIREPRLLRDLAERNLAWMNRWVRGVAASPAP
jgi:dipeptidyl aminopeptidase/acylaminoacyl peptidase